MAHSVNAFEEVGVGLVLHPDEKEGRVVGTAALGHRLVGWQAQDLQQFDRLASLVLTELVEPKIAELESQFVGARVKFRSTTSTRSRG